MRRFLKGFVIGLVLASGAVALADTWNATFEGDPQGTDLASDLDTFIQDFKKEVRRRGAVEAIFGNGTDDNGLNRVGSARCFAANAAPTAIAGPGQYDGASSSYVAANLSSTENGASTDDVGKGRCWLDLDGPDDTAGTPDDYTVWVYSETKNDWVLPGSVDPLLLDTGDGAPFFFDPGKYNLIYNGSFEITDGTGALAATAVPSGWTDTDTSTFGYAATPAAQGDGAYLSITAAGADEGIQRTLAGLKASTTYYVTARAKPVTGGDICYLLTTGGGTNLPGTGINRIASGTAWSTISGYFKTDATPTDVVLKALVADGDVCQFDHIAVYETSVDRRGISQPGVQVCRSTSTDNTENAYGARGGGVFADALVSCTVNIPGPGYVSTITGAIHFENDDAFDRALECRMRENCNGAGATTVATGQAAVATDNAADSEDNATCVLNYAKATYTSGDSCVYTLEGMGASSAMDRNRGAAEGGNRDPVEQPVTYIQTVTIPAR